MTGLETEETKALREAEADQHSDSTGTTAQEETISREEVHPEVPLSEKAREKNSTHRR